MIKTAVTSIITILVAAVSMVLPALADCTDFHKSIAGASRAGDAKKTAGLYSQAETSHSCSGNELLVLARLVAFGYMRQAAGKNQSDATRKQLFVQALKYGRPWQLLASLGDLEKSAGNWNSATGYYFQALDDMGAENPARNAINQKLIISRILAPDYEPILVRCGQAKATARKPVVKTATAFRGCGSPAGSALLPVSFPPGSIHIDQKAAKILTDILAFLQGKASPAIRLTGHADPLGNLSNNLKLSKRRAVSVAFWFRQHGYKARITINAKGSNLPMRTDDAKYSTLEQNTLQRRVEISIE